MFNVYIIRFLQVVLLINVIIPNLHLAPSSLKDLFKDENDDDLPENIVIKLKDNLDDLELDLFATSNGLEKRAQITEFTRGDNLYHFQMMKDDGKRKRRSDRDVEDKLEMLRRDDRVEFVIPQPYLKRVKRRLSISDEQLDHEIRNVLDEVNHDFDSNTRRRNLDEIKEDIRKEFRFNDVDFAQEWYVINEGQLNTPAGHDLNIKEAWKRGYTGKNITIVIVDDGLDYEHEDFVGKYKPEVSYDYNGEDEDPMPGTFDNQNNHGTRCAGAAAAAANNSICGVGVAFDAYVGGLRILDGPITDVLEARALSYKSQIVDIRSASWGPRDDGAHMEYPGLFVNMALEEGVKFGRNGKGTIYIWASGNGGSNDDDCSCDGYVSHWNVISIGSVNHHGKMPYFMETCPSTMAVVYSGGSSNARGDKDDPGVRVIASDVRGKCTTTFQGTSSAAPLAAGAIALVLEANPDLTYRDVMYIIAKTSRIPNIEDTDGWIINGAQYHVNEKYGFGVLDVGQMVQEAQRWKNVEERYNCFIEYSDEYPKLPPSGHREMTIDVQNCPNVDILEHVVANISFSYSLRGDLRLTLVSPSGTPSEILSYRKNDFSSKGIHFFPFMTLFNWGESPIGKWKLIIETRSRNKQVPNDGSINYFALRLFGTTKKEPENVSSRVVDTFSKSYEASEDDVRDIYYREKRLSKNLNIISRNFIETSPEIRSLLKDLEK